MEKISQKLKSYIETHPFDSGSDDCTTVLDQFYLAYANSHESDPPEIREGFKELEEFLHHIPLSDNNAVCAVCDLCCRLCGEYEHKAFIDGVFLRSTSNEGNKLTKDAPSHTLV